MVFKKGVVSGAGVYGRRRKVSPYPQGGMINGTSVASSKVVFRASVVSAAGVAFWRGPGGSCGFWGGAASSAGAAQANTLGEKRPPEVNVVLGLLWQVG